MFGGCLKKTIIFFLLIFIVCAETFAAKKDFKGLFGSYRREKFTENEARKSDFGVDLLLSTLIPLSPLVKSAEDPAGANFSALQYSTFFNVEATIFYSLFYHWQLFANIGYYTYSTRKENVASDVSNPELPLFHQFEIQAIPVTGGVKYRFSTEDIVPYVGAGIGYAFVKRKGSYDSSAAVDNDSVNVIAGQVMAGFEFYFSPRAGLRLEAAAFYMKLPQRTFNPQGNPAITPVFMYEANPLLMRYASGLFVLF